MPISDFKMNTDQNSQSNSVIQVGQEINPNKADESQNWASKAANWAKQRHQVEQQQQMQYQYYQQYGTQYSPYYFTQSNAVLPAVPNVPTYNPSVYQHTLPSVQYQSPSGGLPFYGGQQYPVASHLSSQIPTEISFSHNQSMQYPSFRIPSHINTGFQPHSIVPGEIKPTGKSSVSTLIAPDVADKTHSFTGTLGVQPTALKPYFPPIAITNPTSTGIQIPTGEPEMTIPTGGPYSSIGGSYPTPSGGPSKHPTTAGPYPTPISGPSLQLPTRESYLTPTGRPEEHPPTEGPHPLFGGRRPLFSADSVHDHPFNSRNFATLPRHFPHNSQIHLPVHVASQHQPPFRDPALSHRSQPLLAPQRISNSVATTTVFTSTSSSAQEVCTTVPHTQPLLPSETSSADDRGECKFTWSNKEGTRNYEAGIMDHIQLSEGTHQKHGDIVKVDNPTPTEPIEQEGKPCIPGLDLVEKSVKVSSVPSSKETQSSTAMLSSLGKIVTQLQALKSMKTTATDVVSCNEEEYSEAQKKVAALIENESDSDDDKQDHRVLSATQSPIQARDFDGFEHKEYSRKSKLQKRYHYDSGYNEVHWAHDKPFQRKNILHKLPYNDDLVLRTSRHPHAIHSSKKSLYQEERYPKSDANEPSYQEKYHENFFPPPYQRHTCTRSDSPLPCNSSQNTTRYPQASYHHNDPAQDYDRHHRPIVRASRSHDRFLESELSDSPSPKDSHPRKRPDSPSFGDYYQHKRPDSPSFGHYYQYKRPDSLSPRDSYHRRPDSPSPKEYYTHGIPSDHYDRPQSTSSRHFYNSVEFDSPNNSYEQTSYQRPDSFHQQDHYIPSGSPSQRSPYQQDSWRHESSYETKQYVTPEEHQRDIDSSMKTEFRQPDELPSYVKPQGYSFLESIQSVDYEHGKTNVSSNVTTPSTGSDWFYQQANLSPLINYTLKELQQKGLPKWLKEELQNVKASTGELNITDVISDETKWKGEFQAESKDHEQQSERKQSSSVVHLVRQVMTEVLLDVTTTEIYSLANEILGFKSDTASFSSPATVESHSLGLTVYCSDDDDSSDSDSITPRRMKLPSQKRASRTDIGEQKSEKNSYGEKSKQKSSHHRHSKKKHRKKSPTTVKASKKTSEKDSSLSDECSSSSHVDPIVDPSIKNSKKDESFSRLSFSVFPSKRKTLFDSSNWDAPSRVSSSKDSPSLRSSKRNSSPFNHPLIDTCSQNSSKEDLPSQGSSQREVSWHESSKSRNSTYDHSKRETQSCGSKEPPLSGPSKRGHPSYESSKTTNQFFYSSKVVASSSKKDTSSYIFSNLRSPSFDPSKRVSSFSDSSKRDASRESSERDTSHESSIINTSRDSSKGDSFVYRSSRTSRGSSKRDTSPHRSSKRNSSTHASSKVDTSPRRSSKRDTSPNRSPKRHASPLRSSKRNSSPRVSSKVDTSPLRSSKRDTSRESNNARRETYTHTSSKRDTSPHVSSKRDTSCSSKRDTRSRRDTSSQSCVSLKRDISSRESFREDSFSVAKRDVHTKHASSSHGDKLERKISPSHSYFKRSSPVSVKRHLSHHTSTPEEKRLKP